MSKMNEDEKMFQIGLWFFSIILVISIALQVCYRAQNKARNKVHSEIVRVQQEIASSQANFASFVRPEILRNLVTGVVPKAQIIGFNKIVDISSLPDRETKK